jgi:hypothetical protein
VTNSLWELLEVHLLVHLWAEKLGKYDQMVTKYPATRSIQKHSLGYINLLKLMQLRCTCLISLTTISWDVRQAANALGFPISPASIFLSPSVQKF